MAAATSHMATYMSLRRPSDSSILLFVLPDLADSAYHAAIKHLANSRPVGSGKCCDIASMILLKLLYGRSYYINSSNIEIRAVVGSDDQVSSQSEQTKPTVLQLRKSSQE